MLAQPLSTCSNGLYKVISGRYLLHKINSKQVRRYNLTGDQPDPEKLLDIEYYNHCLVTEVPLIRLINQVRRKKDHDTSANAANNTLHKRGHEERGLHSLRVLLRT